MDKMKENRVYISKTEVLKRATIKKQKLINGDFVPPDPIDEILAVADAGLLDDIIIKPPPKKKKKIPKPEPPIQAPPEVVYVEPEIIPDPVIDPIIDEVVKAEERIAIRKAELQKQIDELEGKA